MKRRSIGIAVFLLFFAGARAYALDRDDDVGQDTQEHILYEASGAGAEIEAKYPEEAARVREALLRHVRHANGRDLDGYMSDFLPERVRYPEEERAYAARAMSLDGLEIEVRAIEFSGLTRTSATVHTRQLSRYRDAAGRAVVDDAVVSYRFLRDSRDGEWRIAFSERRRLGAKE